MDDKIFFDEAKNSVVRFFDTEFENFPTLIISHFLNQFNDILNYSEEGATFKPQIIFTDNIETITKSIPKSYALPIFEDPDATKFNLRMKAIFAIAKNKWCIFIDIRDGKITYGMVMSFRSVKDKSFLRVLEENTTLKDKPVKIHCVIVRPISIFSMSFHSISGNNLTVNLSLDSTKNNVFMNEVRSFVDTAFSKLRTTQRKLQDMKNLYINIFSTVMNDVNGAICLIVDKEYADNGMLEDGIWLKEPISFSKLFSQSKSYSEEKLQAYADLFINMLNFDGITVIDNQGRIRAYNVFVESNSKRVGYIVGGARKRAAYFLLSSKKKGLVGVYFQSHEGEVFFQKVKRYEETELALKQKKQDRQQLQLNMGKVETVSTPTQPRVSPAKPASETSNPDESMVQLSLFDLPTTPQDENKESKKSETPQPLTDDQKAVETSAAVQTEEKILKTPITQANKELETEAPLETEPKSEDLEPELKNIIPAENEKSVSPEPQVSSELNDLSEELNNTPNLEVSEDPLTLEATTALTQNEKGEVTSEANENLPVKPGNELTYLTKKSAVLKRCKNFKIKLNQGEENKVADPKINSKRVIIRQKKAV